MEYLENLPSDLKEIYRKNFSAIRTRIVNGRIRVMYHFMITDAFSVAEYVGKVKADHQTKPRKINVALGFILKNIETEKLQFFYPSQNSLIFDQPLEVSTEDDYKKLLRDLEQQDLFEYATIKRPSTKWRVIKLACLRFDVYKLDAS